MSLQDSTFNTAHVMDNEIVKANDFEFAFEKVVENVSKATQMLLESNQDFVINGKVLPYQGMNVQISPIFGVCKSTGIPFGRTETAVMEYGFEESGSGRRDIIEVKGEWETYDNQQRAFNDPDTNVQTYQYVDTKKLMRPVYRIKKGVEGSNVAPEVDEGYVKIAEVVIRANNSTITASDIKNITADIAGLDNEGWTTEANITYNVGYISEVNERFRVQHNADGTHKDNVINTDSLDIGTGSKQVNGNVLPIGSVISIPGQTTTASDSIVATITKAVTVITSLYNNYLKFGVYGFKGTFKISSLDSSGTLVKPLSITAPGDGTAVIKIDGNAILSIDANGRISTNGYTANSNNNLVTKLVTDSITTALNGVADRVTNLETRFTGQEIYTNKVLSTDRYNVDSVNLVVATTANITLSGLQTIDGITLVADQKVLVKNQTNAKNNGIYTVNSSTWSRTTEYNTPAKLKGKIFIISNGTTNAGKMFFIPNESFVSSSSFGSDDINFVEFIGSISPLSYKLAMRTSDGRVKTATPSESNDSVNKGFLTINNLGMSTGLVAATCSTAAATAAKTVTLSGFTLKKAAKLFLTISNSNTSATALTLNVNSTGAKTIKVNGTVTSTSSYTLAAGDYVAEYDGTYWCLENAYMTTSARSSNTANTATQSDYSRQGAYCTTAAGTAAKVASMRGFVLQNGATFPITFTNANSAASALTLAINSTTAKPIYINNAVSSATNYTLPAGTYLCRYNGTNFYIDTSYAVTQARNANYATSAGSAGSATTASKLAASVNINGTAFDGSAAITTTKWGTARDIKIQDSDGTNTGSAVSVDGSEAKTLKLPSTIKASITGDVSGSSGSCTGNAATATKLKTARTINIQDADGINSGTGISFDGSADKTLKLPSTIKASITGNCSGSSGSCTGNAATATAPKDTASMPSFGAIAYCETAAATAAKTASCDSYKLVAGQAIKLYIKTANTASSPTLNINSTGAKSIFVNGVAASTSNITVGWWVAIYDGTYYQLFSADILPAVGCAVCLTAAATAAKVATMPGFSLVSGSVFLLYLKTTNTASSPTLNINGTGAKPVYVNNAAATTSNFTAGVYLVRYNGTNFYIDKEYFVTNARNANYANSAGSVNNTYALSLAVSCSTAATEAAKTVTLSGFSLRKGARLLINVANTNTKNTVLTLNVNSTGAKTIKLNGTVTSASHYGLSAGVYNCYYDGTYWCMESGYEVTNARNANHATSAGSADTAATCSGTSNNATNLSSKTWGQTACYGAFVTTNTSQLTSGSSGMSSGVYTFTVTTPDGTGTLADGSVVRLTFKYALQANIAITGVKLTFGGRTGSIKAQGAYQETNSISQLVDLKSHVFTGGNWSSDFANKVWDAYTTLELMWTGSEWLVMGDTVLCSYFSTSQSYTVKANGLIEQWGTVTYSHAYAVCYTQKAVPTIRSFNQETTSLLGNFIASSTNTSFTVELKWGDYTTSNNTIEIEWYAIGY